jgi:hypothetical protein
MAPWSRRDRDREARRKGATDEHRRWRTCSAIQLVSAQKIAAFVDDEDWTRMRAHVN